MRQASETRGGGDGGVGPAPASIVTVKPVSLGRMMTRAEAATALGVSTRTVSELARRGELPTFRFGGRPRFLPADVLALKETRSACGRRAA